MYLELLDDFVKYNTFKIDICVYTIILINAETIIRHALVWKGRVYDTF